MNLKYKKFELQTLIPKHMNISNESDEFFEQKPVVKSMFDPKSRSS